MEPGLLGSLRMGRGSGGEKGNGLLRVLCHGRALTVEGLKDGQI
jgi:hypothetical protein